MPDMYKLNALRERAWKLEQELHEDDPRLFETQVLAFLLECELERYQEKLHEKQYAASYGNVHAGSIHYDYVKKEIYADAAWPPVKVVAKTDLY